MRCVGLAGLVIGALLSSAGPAAAQPDAPPNPPDKELAASRDAVTARAVELGRLSTLVADLDAQAAETRDALRRQQETAFQRLIDLRAAQDAADEAVQRVEASRTAEAASVEAVERAQDRLDAFATMVYQQTLDLGPLGLLANVQTPDELVDRAEFTALVGREQQRALDGLLGAHTELVNAGSTARAAEEEVRARRDSAEQSKVEADEAVATALAAVGEQDARLRGLDVERAAVEAQLDALRANDQRLQNQRRLFDGYEKLAAQQAEEARVRATQAAPVAPPSPQEATGSKVATAAAALGPQYACRVGTPRWGPVKPWVADAGQLLRCRFGVASVGGVGSRPNPSDHPAGLALDFFVDRPTGDSLAECALRHREALAVKYVIFRQRINTGTGWQMMEDRGSPVANHMEHVHISFNSRPGGPLGSVNC